MTHKRALAVLALSALALPGFALADPGKGKGPKNDARAERVDRDVRIVLGDRERDVMRDYYRSSCPPGLAKKNNGCLPPGQAKKRYEVGRRIPDGWDYLPDDLSRRLPRLGEGYDYRLMDGDLLVLDLASMLVMDAIGVY